MAEQSTAGAAGIRPIFDGAGKPIDPIIDSIERRYLIPLSDQRVWELERAGLFPKRVKVGEGKYGKVGWYLSEVLAYMESKRVARDAEMAEAS